ncbi:murein biosynthesis integral membrane protein MurJ [Acetobacteraceae bacterium]|nr:murein biosynthesis integral membrane protein MurJ [Acetobacteraceae bacterium]
MLKNLFTVGSWTMVSRILGLIRDQLLAILLGAGSAQDAYQIALRLPNMFRRFFGEGAFNAAFIPLFTTEWEKHGQKQAMNFASEAFSTLLAFLIIITLLAELMMPLLVTVVAPGFLEGDGSRFNLAVQFSRITMPYMTLICSAALVAGILNSREKYAAASIAYVSFNVIGILSIILGAILANLYLPSNDLLQKEILTVKVGAWGILLSGFVQLMALFWACKKAGLTLTKQLPSFSARIKRLLKRILPSLIGSGVTQLNLTIDTIIATLLPTGSVSWLYFADRLTQLPLGILGAALGTTLLPTFSKSVANKQTDELIDHLSKAINLACYFILPMTIGIIAIAPLLIAGLFGYGHFQTFDIIQTSKVLRVYAIGLPAFVLLKALAPVFFAQGDTSTPVKVGFIAIIINLAASILLYKQIGLLAPAIASDLAAYFNLFLLSFILYKKKILNPYSLLRKQSKIFFLATTMGLMAFEAIHFANNAFLNWSFLLKISLLMLIILMSAIFYLGFSWKFSLFPEDILKLIRRKSPSRS